jgi:hypothetical protein
MPPEDGQVSLGPLTISFPDESFDTFWFMHDLVDMLGVEGNSDARAALRAALKGRRGVRLEHEADNVVVHAKGVKAMTDVLVALDSLAVARPLWSAEVFEQAIATMNAWRRPRPAKYDARDIVAVPLSGCSPVRFGAAQVAIFSSALWPPATRAASPRNRGGPLFFLFDLSAPSIDDLRRQMEAGAGRALGCRIVSDTAILSGKWPIIGARPVPEGEALAALTRELYSSTTSVDYLMMRYAGLWAWDGGNPILAEQYLLPGVLPPPNRRYVRDLLEARLVAAFGRIPDPVREGPAVLHVHIAYPGNGLPRIIDIPKADRLVELMKKTVPGIGEVFEGGGGGFLDVIARTSDAVAGVHAVEQAILQLRLVKDTLIDCFPDVSLDDLYVVDRSFTPSPARTGDLNPTPGAGDKPRFSLDPNEGLSRS